MNYTRPFTRHFQSALQLKGVSGFMADWEMYQIQ